MNGSITREVQSFKFIGLALVLASASLLTVGLSNSSAAYAKGADSIAIEGHLPHLAISSARHVGRLDAKTQVPLSVALKLKNEDQLADFIARVQDPRDVLYGQYLTPEQFAANYAPSESDVAQVSQFLESQGLKVKNIHSNRLVIEVEGSAAQVERAFEVELHQYVKSNGKVAFSPLSEPRVDAQIAPLLTGVIGISNFTEHTRSHATFKELSPRASHGPSSGVTPQVLRAAYNVDSIPQQGQGEPLGLMELDGYKQSDIENYARQFGFTSMPSLQNVLIDGFNGSAGKGAVEVTLDIEVMMAIAPQASAIFVYEGPNSDAGLLATYSRIATDNQAREISSSWGVPEAAVAASTLRSENAIFMQMASQGQTLYAASGDSGAYDNGSTLGVDDPASQPYVTGVGGTTLSISSNGAYSGESSWGSPANGRNPASGGGGGISAVWTIPNWQAGFGNSSNRGSSTMRMVPDVSLDANPQTGYVINFNGKWGVVGGTSCAAPIWAGYTALINQARIAKREQPIGFAAPLFYAIAKSAAYESDFHDVADGSNNLFYPAVAGYDLSTGLGSFNGANLFSTLAR